jgi:hypothetical protein
MLTVFGGIALLFAAVLAAVHLTVLRGESADGRRAQG